MSQTDVSVFHFACEVEYWLHVLTKLISYLTHDSWGLQSYNYWLVVTVFWFIEFVAVPTQNSLLLYSHFWHEWKTGVKSGDEDAVCCHLCKTRLDHCVHCDNAEVCLRCAANTAYLQGAQNKTTCTEKCPIGYFGHGTELTTAPGPTCQSCSSNCHTCTDESTCTKCMNKNFLINGTCVPDCTNTVASDGSVYKLKYYGREVKGYNTDTYGIGYTCIACDADTVTDNEADGIPHCYNCTNQD